MIFVGLSFDTIIKHNTMLLRSKLSCTLGFMQLMQMKQARSWTVVEELNRRLMLLLVFCFSLAWYRFVCVFCFVGFYLKSALKKSVRKFQTTIVSVVVISFYCYCCRLWCLCDAYTHINDRASRAVVQSVRTKSWVCCNIRLCGYVEWSMFFQMVVAFSSGPIFH